MSTNRLNNQEMTDTEALTDVEQAELYRLLQRAGVRKPPPRNTEEIRKILDKVPGGTVAAKARRVGVARWTWYQWLAGEFRPSGKHAAKIARMTGVPLHHITGNQP